MKNLLIFSIFILFLTSCYKKEKTTEVILVFEEDIVLPNTFFDFDSSKNENTLYNDAVMSYTNVLEKIKPTTTSSTGIGMDGGFRNFDKTIELIPKLKIFKGLLSKAISTTVTIRPVFDLADVKTFYKITNKILSDTSTSVKAMVTEKGRNCTDINLLNVAVISCMTSSDIEKLKATMTQAGINKVTVLDNYTLNKNNKNFTTPIVCSKALPFKQLMGIERLNAFRFDSAGATKTINGKNASLILVENAKPVDFGHFKFSTQLRKNFHKRQDSLATGDDVNHATYTFGTIFASNAAVSNQPNCTNGIAKEANLRKIIYFNSTSCSDQNGSISYDYGAVLKALNSSEIGDILLIEFQTNGCPIEMDPIEQKLVAILTNIRGVTVIEAIGEQIGTSSDLNSLVSGQSKLPATFEGILVASAKPAKKNIIKFEVSSNYHKTMIDCFGIDSIQTTVVGNKFALFGSSSAAAAEIAGLALAMQGYYFTKNGRYMTPQQMKALFKTKTANDIKVTRFNQVVPNAMNLKMVIDSINANTLKQVIVPCKTSSNFKTTK